MQTVERWGIFETEIQKEVMGNPFTDAELTGTFTGQHETVTVDGFYDGGNTFKIRFMPSFEGEYTYSLRGSMLNEALTGTFTVIAPSKNNHGPVRVANTTHFAYEDGTPYYPLGTTCYVWTHQQEELQQKTLEELSKGYFNKIRFCVFPKHYDYNFREPLTYPYEGTPMDSSVLTKENFGGYGPDSEGNNWDFTRLNPAHFQQIETRIRDLMKLGIEADIIVMHPYDRWGFSTMSKEQDDLYWNYIIARFSAFRNVWWSLANEYDLMRKDIADWERYASIIVKKDPYNHLRSIHNCGIMYDYSRPWITHCSIQRVDMYRTAENAGDWQKRWKKPVVLDEIVYEGNINHCWGNISGQELVRRFWEAALRGGYGGHGETYTHPKDILWWSHGGELHGEGPERIRFLLKLLYETPGLGLSLVHEPLVASNPAFAWDDLAAEPTSVQHRGSYYLLYFGNFRPSFRTYYFDEKTDYDVEVIDTWNMTITPVGTFRGKFRVELPGREYMALRIRKK